MTEASSTIVIEDWQDYDQSLLSTVGERYYKNQGIDAFSQKIVKLVPNEISNCYPHACSIIKALKSYIQSHNKKQITLLDIGCGSGIFARHLLIAAKEEKLNCKFKVLLADFSKKSLTQIQNNKSLAEFKQGQDYELLEVDIRDLGSCQNINGEKFELKNIDVVTMNYVFDALPTLILRPSKNSDKLEKLQFRISTYKEGGLEVNDQNLVEDPNLLNKLLIEDRWVDYNIEEQNKTQQKYFNLIDPQQTNHLDQVIFNYGSLQAVESLLNLIEGDGFIYASDVITDQNSKSSFIVYGNATVHYVNTNLLSKLTGKLGCQSFNTRDTILERMLYFKKPESFSKLKNELKTNFVDTSYTDIYHDLRQCLGVILSAHSKSNYKYLVDQLLKIDKFSYFSHLVRGQQHEFFGDKAQALKLYHQARNLDFLGSHGADTKIQALEN